MRSPTALAHALHLYLARSAAVLVALQLEDLLGETLPVNVPGTRSANIPIGSASLAVAIDELPERREIAAHLDEIHAARGG